MQWAELLTRLERLNPVLAAHLARWQKATIQCYADAIWNPFDGQPATPSQVVLNRIEHVSQDYFGCGSEIARRLSGHLSESPVVLTVHHTAPFFHPIALQTLLLAVAGTKPPRCLPVLSTDWVPMDNMFHPRGMLIRSGNDTHCIHLFGKKSRKQSVSMVAAFDETMVQKLKNALVQNRNKNILSEPVAQQALEFVDRFYLHPCVLNQSTYRKQCSLINRLAWHELFPDIDLQPINISDFIVPLLQQSIRDTDSLVHRVLFDASTRSAVLDVLDGVGGCWDTLKQSGTLLFWQQQGGKLHALTTVGQNVLRNSNAEFAIEPESICDCLDDGSLVPGLFLVFLQLMFVDRLACIGGMRQISYNTAIREGLARVFSRRCPELLSVIETFPVDRFAAGLNVVNSEQGRPATLLELLPNRHLLHTGWRTASFQRAVLQASDYLLELSG